VKPHGNFIPAAITFLSNDRHVLSPHAHAMTKFTTSLLSVALVGCRPCSKCKNITSLYLLAAHQNGAYVVLRYGVVFDCNGKSARYAEAQFVATILGFSSCFICQ